MKFLRVDDVLTRVGYASPVTLYELERHGHFPPRRRIGPNRVGWLESEIDDWIQNRTKGIGARVEVVAAPISDGPIFQEPPDGKRCTFVSEDGARCRKWRLRRRRSDERCNSHTLFGY